MFGLRLFFRLFIFTFFLLQAYPAEAAKRETRTFVLKNGLEVLLIHDPEVHRSAAALSVGVGSLYDPDEKLGMAHYLEHMLFLGTKKYPKVGSYKKYLEENSGGSNAYTGDVVTNYFFQVSHGAFEGATDRFSGFFKEPLFDKEYAEREVNAVSSEHDKNKLRDGWRASRVIDQISEEGHPIKKFGTGNKETLAGDNRPALLEFHHRYYAASKMKLAMLSKFSLEVQEEIAEKYFGDIPDRRVTMPPISPDYRKPLKDRYRLLKVKTIKDRRILTLTFPTIRLHDHLESKPEAIVGSVIGYEGRGSLLSKLKKEGLALGLSAGGGYGHPNLSSFDIKISLTKKGEKEYERVLEIVFAYIQMLKQTGIREYTFQEAQTMAQIDFDWKSPEEGARYVASRSGLMQNYKLEDVETLPYLFRKFDPEAYKAVLDTLNSGNMLAVLQARSVETDRREKFYGAEYSITEVGGAAFEKLRTPHQVASLQYPERNEFIPKHLSLLKEGPQLVRDDDIAKVWFQFDHRFKQPKVDMRLRIETPRVYDTVRNLARSRLYVAAVQEGLNELVYPIQLAGLSYSLSVEKKGVVLQLGGYSERLTELLRLVAKNLTKIEIDEQKFNDLKRARIRSLENRKLSQAYRRAVYYNRLLWLVKQYNEDELLEELKSVTFEEVKEHAKGLYDRSFMSGTVYGNWTREKVRESLEILLGEIKSKPLPEDERFQQVVEVLEPGEKALMSAKVATNNNALYYTLQIGKMDFSTHAKASMVASIVETDFYKQMRTNQQLGYIVWSFNDRVEDRLFFKMIIQSASYGPFELKKRVEAWLKQSRELFDQLTDDEFERYRKALIVSLKKEGDNIAEVNNDLYRFATREKGNFRFKKQVIEAVKKLRKEEVIAAATKILLEPKTPRIVVLIRSRTNNKPVPKTVLTAVDQFKN
ncbi:MAG: insulinase family protein, partial [Deltaproteobacteria bacterium]|nr:insulinase family protein [Deltaproteobacteria bacterium]